MNYTVSIFPDSQEHVISNIAEGVEFNGRQIIFRNERQGLIKCILDHPSFSSVSMGKEERGQKIRALIDGINIELGDAEDSLQKISAFIEKGIFAVFSYEKRSEEKSPYRVWDNFMRSKPLAEVLLYDVPKDLDTLTKDQYSGLLDIVTLLGITWDDVVNLRKVNSQFFAKRSEVYFRDGCMNLLHLINHTFQDEQKRYYVVGERLCEATDRLLELYHEVVSFEEMTIPYYDKGSM
ncbi:MAG: hypothetical protein KKA54_11975 [Proteobacteria bacterium]|nr:hypothetical protein [Pseudomonadota bacterium]MBU0967083.1 hypothetical protein [Pseudomonadota bacterium]